MSSLNVFLRFSLFLLLRNFINLVLHDHIRIILLCCLSLSLLGKVFQAELGIAGVDLVWEQSSCCGGIPSFQCREEVIHQHTSHLLLGLLLFLLLLHSWMRDLLLVLLHICIESRCRDSWGFGTLWSHGLRGRSFS